MKPFDSKGEYSPEEVKAALAGTTGTRQLSFRYERLDKDNFYVEDIDYVQSCTIENNALADIKRTAKLDILDIGTINYLQDRIKPYVRIDMPKDRTYPEAVKAFDPDAWWKLDDPTSQQNVTSATNLADALTYGDQANAYSGTTDTGKEYTLKYQGGSATLRNEAWIVYPITVSDALEFKFTYFSGPGTPTFEVYTAAAIDGDLALEHTVTGASTSYWTKTYPAKGFIFVRMWNADNSAVTTVKLSAKQRTRFEDSSNTRLKAVGYNWVMGQPSLVGPGTAGKVSTGTTSANAATITTDSGLGLLIDEAITFNYWIDMDATFQNQSKTSGSALDITMATSDPDWSMNFKLTPNTGSTSSMIASLSLNGFYSEVMVPKPKLVTGPHMISVIYAPTKDRAELWIDGTLFAPFIDTTGDPLSVGTHGFLDATLSSIDVKAYTTTGSVVIDDVSVFCRELGKRVLADIYDLGALALTGAGRSGYVEWPQGVFVLSSPTRNMADGNTVIREVDGYDQLVVLKEDSFDYRYSVKAGAKYTDAVKAVLKSTTAVSNIVLTSELWSTYAGAVILSDTAATLQGPSAGTYPGLSTEVAATSFGDMDISLAMSGTSDGYTLLYMRSGVRDFGFFKSADGDLSVLVDGVTATAVTYSATNHKYWRFREVRGTLLYETSANGSTWSLLHSAPNPMKPDDPVHIIIEAQRISTANTIRIDDVKLSARLNPSVDIVNSTIKLPTAMEWEPGTPKLSIINDLLGAVNYNSATYNEDGMFVSKPYISPSDRTPEYTYATDSNSVIIGDVSQTVDLFGIPNKWIVVVSDPDRPMLVGEYVNDSPNSPTSTVSRGRTIVDYRTEQAAPDQVTLDAQASRLAFEASQVYESVEFDTALMPIHQNADVFLVNIDGLTIDNKYSEHSWSMELKNGAIMSHKIRRVVSV